METTNQPSSKHHKLVPSSCDDRISSLPDSVLCHILSFLPTKLSVATSVLAKRWRFLWTYVTNLEFDGEYYDTEESSEDQMTFPEIINRVMMLRKNVCHIRNFSISYIDDLSRHELETWIRNAIACNIQALDLYLHHQVRLPRCLFTCNTLVHLRLSLCIGLPGAGVCLPSLKNLYLHTVKYEVDRKLSHLISGCPVLEELFIEGIDDYDTVCCVISSPTLKSLNLEFLYDSDEYRHDYELQINAPALRYLILKDYLSEHMSVGTLNSLVDADIFLRNNMVEEDVRYSRSMLETFERLSQVKYLRLSCCYVKFLNSAFTAPTTRFHNLTKLDLAADWRFLIKFLECADNLESLIIREVDADLKCWIEPQTVPVCLSLHLRDVKIHFMESVANDFEIIKYFLGKGKVLNNMEIEIPDFGSRSIVECFVRHTISNFHRASEKCKVAFL